MKTTLVLLAGGKGTRLQREKPKQYLEIEGKTIAEYALEPFLNHPKISSIVVVCDPFYQPIFQALTSSNPIEFAMPGAERQDSLENGLKKVQDQSLVLVHDAARPLFEPTFIDKLMDAASDHPAVVIGVRSTSTLKKVSPNREVIDSVDRASVWEVQTPQLAPKKLLVKALAYAHENNLAVTDESSLMQLIDVPVKMVEGSRLNFKVTTQADLQLFEALKRNEQYV